jgi:protein-disulfide isomerase
MKRLALLAAAAVALALSGCQKTPDAAFGDKVRAYLLEHPEVIEEAVTKLRQNQMLEQAKATLGRGRQVPPPAGADPRDLVINPNGKFTIVGVLRLPLRLLQAGGPEVVKLIAENPDVRFVFKEFPIFGEVSDTAARMALTSDGKAKGLALYKSWMNDRALDEAALDRHLAEAGLDPARVRKAASDPAIETQLADVRDLAKRLGLEGTPAFVVGDYLIPGADIAARPRRARPREGRRTPGRRNVSPGLC